MMTVRKTSIFPASRGDIFSKLQKLETLQYIAAPYATFTPVNIEAFPMWKPGSVTSYRLKLFGVIPCGLHTIRIEKFHEVEGVSSKEGNAHVPVWNHDIFLKIVDDTHTEYTDQVVIDAGWKTIFVYLWACCFYTHRQRRWIKLLRK